MVVGNGLTFERTEFGISLKHPGEDFELWMARRMYSPEKKVSLVLASVQRDFKAIGIGVWSHPRGGMEEGGVEKGGGGWEEREAEGEMEGEGKGAPKGPSQEELNFQRP